MQWYAIKLIVTSVKGDGEPESTFFLDLDDLDKSCVGVPSPEFFSALSKLWIEFGVPLEPRLDLPLLYLL